MIHHLENSGLSSRSNRMLLCALSLWFGVVLCRSFEDPDLWWHITIGRWILAHAEIPRVELWNRFALGTSLTAYSWLPELVFAIGDRIGAEWGLFLLKFSLGTGLAYSALYCLTRVCGTAGAGVLFGIATILSVLNGFTLRPQALMWVFLIWVLYFAEHILIHGLTWRKLGAILFIFALWANTHLTTPLGIGIVFAWLWNPRPGSWKVLIIVASLSILATLCTPYSGKEWLTLVEMSTHPIHFRRIGEFRMASSTAISLWAVIALFIFCAVSLPLKMIRDELLRIIVVVCLVFGAVFVSKFLPCAGIVCSFFCARMVRARRAEGLPSPKYFNRAISHWFQVNLADLSYAMLFTACLAVGVRSMFLSRNPFNEEIIPKSAVDYMLSQDLPHPFLNFFNYGGYLMYRLSNRSGEIQYPVSIDGRTNVAPAIVWEKFEAAFSGTDTWWELVDLVGPKTILWDTPSYFEDYLLEFGQWCRVFRFPVQGKGAVVLVARDFFESHKDKFPSLNCDMISADNSPKQLESEHLH